MTDWPTLAPRPARTIPACDHPDVLRGEIIDWVDVRATDHGLEQIIHRARYVACRVCGAETRTPIDDDRAGG